MSSPTDPSVRLPVHLIAGSGRSGTTILKRVLGAHPAYPDLPEMRFMLDPDGILDFYSSMQGSWSPNLAAARIDRLEDLLTSLAHANRVTSRVRSALIARGIAASLPRIPWSRYASVGLEQSVPSYLDLVETLIRRLTDFEFDGEWVGMGALDSHSIRHAAPLGDEEARSLLGGFYRDIAAAAVAKQRASSMLDKGTWYILWIDRMLELVPEAKLVAIHRDPRDVTASYMRQNWSPSDPIHAATWLLDIMERWWEIRKALPASSYLEVSLEELVASPEPVLRRILDFYETEWSDEVLGVELQQNVSNWRAKLPPAARERVSEIVAPIVSEYGYET